MKGDAAGQGVVPLRTILRNILNLIDSFEARYKEGLDSYDQEFQELKQFSENLKSDPNYACKEGEKGVNRKKNRYKDILPFDYTRVILGDYGDIPGSDYINANFIKGASGSSAYIACQGPLPHTVNDFWRMVVECEVQVIVMACNEQESGKHKCENYWVEEEGVEREFGHVTVWLKKSRQVCPDFLVRTMKIRYPNSKGDSEERSVCQFHYSAWPDHGVPLKVRPLLDMVRLIRDCQTSETLPVLIHCSAGCGRTGTICAIDYVWGLLRLGKLTPDFSLFNLVREMRRQRIAMVQTKDQYILVHRAVKELFEEQLKIIDSHPYANVDINGLPLEIRADLEEPVYETVQFSTTSTTKSEDDDNGRIRLHVSTKPAPPPIPNSLSDMPSSSSVAASKHEKEAENHQRQLEQEKLKVINTKSGGGVGGGSSGSSSSSGGGKVNKVYPPSSSSESQGDSSSGVENKHVPEPNRDLGSDGGGKRGSVSKSGSSPKSALFRNPSMIKLKAFFEKSKDDKEKKTIPMLSRAKSDVSSSSRFYTNFASSFTSRGSRNSPSRSKNAGTASSASGSKSASPKEEGFHEKSPVEKKSKPAILAKPNLSVKRSKSLKIIRPVEDSSGDKVNLISSSSIITSSDVPDSAKLVRSSISSQSSSSSHSPLDSHAIRVCVKQVDIPKLQKPVSKSVKPESLKASITTLDIRRNSSELRQDDFGHCGGGGGGNGGSSEKDSRQGQLQMKKPDVPSKPHLLEKIITPVTTKSGGLYGATRIKIGFSDDMRTTERGSSSKIAGKIKKYGTVNAKMLSSSSSSSGGGTLLTRSQSHVWQPSKTQVPVRIFSDENLSQIGSSSNDAFDNGRAVVDERVRLSKGFDEPDSVKQSSRKQPLALTQVFSSKMKPVAAAPTFPENPETTKSNDQSRTLATLTSHSSFLEARRRVPKTNPYANYIPNNAGNQNYNDKSQPPPSSAHKLNSQIEKGGAGGSPLTQFHFGENVPMLRNSGGNANIGNSSESSSGPGTPRNSLPGTPTQSIDVLYSPLSLNTSGNYSSVRGGGGQSKSILKGSLSSTPSESDERLDSYRTHGSNVQTPVLTNITGPQRISSVRIAVGVRERRNSFRQAVWKEDQTPTANSIPVDNDKPENIYITTTSSVPYFVKSTSMPLQQQQQQQKQQHPPQMSNSSSSYVTPTPPYGRPHRDYEPIWPDPASSTNPFKIGNEIAPGTKGPPTKLESQVHDRMAEIKVLLEELRAPGKCEDSKQRSSSKELEHSHIPMRKPTDKLSQSFSGEKNHHSSSSGSPSATNLKHHRSLRAPSRPQYQQGLSCFTFRKPSSFESITDQLYAEELRMPGGTVKPSATNDVPPSSSTASQASSSEASRNKSGANFFDDTFQQSRDRSAANNNGHRLNEYVSLRACRSSSATRAKAEGLTPLNKSTPSDSPGSQIHHPAISKSDSTPIPPPRSKRSGTLRRDQGDYANVVPNQFQSKHGWAAGKEVNGISDNHHHHYNNGITSSSSGTSSIAIRNEPSSSSSQHHHELVSRQDLPRMSSSNGQTPQTMSNGNIVGNNTSSPSTDSKAIIRALGLFQAKAANVRSRFANWAESKERMGSKQRSNNNGNNYGSSVMRRTERSIERGGFNESSSHGHPSSVAIAGPSTSKHQYL